MEVSRVVMMWLLVLGGCGGEPGLGEHGESSSGPGSTNDETGLNATDSADTTGGETGTGRGPEPVEPPTFEMLIHPRVDSARAQFWRYRVVDGESDGLQLLHENDATTWLHAHVLSGRRVIYEVNAINPIEPQLRLGGLDGPLPSTTERIDTAGAPGSVHPTLLADGSVLYERGSNLFRVAIDGFEAAAPVDLGVTWLSKYAVEPGARHLVAAVPPDEEGFTDIVLLRFSDLVPQLVARSDPGVSPERFVFTRDGNGVFMKLEEAFLDGRSEFDRLLYARLDEDAPSEPVSLLGDVYLPNEEISFTASMLRPHADAAGALVELREQGRNALLYYAIDDAELQPALAVDDKRSSAHESWSPDGRWLKYVAFENGMGVPTAAYFGDGQVPVLFEYADVLSGTDSFESYWTADSQSVVVTDDTKLERVLLSEDGVFETQLLTPTYDFLTVEAFRPDGQAMVYSASEDGERTLYFVDDSGAQPVVLSGAASSGERPLDPVFSPDGRVVAFGLRSLDNEQPDRVMVVMPELPEDGVEVFVGALASAAPYSFVAAD